MDVNRLYLPPCTGQETVAKLWSRKEPGVRSMIGSIIMLTTSTFEQQGFGVKKRKET